MKRKMIAIAATALCAVLAVPALAFGVGNLSAGQTVAASDVPAQTVAWRGYVDADGDGVCDNYAGQGQGRGQGQGQGGGHHGWPWNLQSLDELEGLLACVLAKTSRMP